jgi:hypothetical protein
MSCHVVKNNWEFHSITIDTVCVCLSVKQSIQNTCMWDHEYFFSKTEKKMVPWVPLLGDFKTVFSEECYRETGPKFIKSISEG